MDKIILIDGNSLINRAFYAMSVLTNREGVYTNAVYGFVNMLTKVITENHPKYLAVAFDVKAPTFRHEMYAEYKAGRRAMPEELKPQFDTLKNLLRAMNIQIIEQAGIEADDILGTLSKRFSTDTVILTGDRDALQLVDGSTEVWLTKKGLSEIERVTPENIKTLFGVDAPGIIELKALMGDASDNIPGVAGVGEVTALKLLAEYPTVDEVYAHIDDVKGKLRDKLSDGKDSAYLSKTLATIKTDCDIDCKIEDCGYDFPFQSEVKRQFECLQFNSLLKRDALFSEEVKVEAAEQNAEVKFITAESALEAIEGSVLSLCFLKDIHLATDENREYIIKISDDLLGDGLPFDIATNAVCGLIKKFKRTVVFDKKQLMGVLKEFGCDAEFKADDLALMSYILGGTAQSAPDLLSKHGFFAEDNAAVGMLKLCEMLKKELSGREVLPLYRTELAVCDVLFAMEQTGCKVDIAVMNQLKVEYGEKLSALEKGIFELAGRNFNINSPKQLGVLLFEDLKLKAGKKTKTGYSTDNEVLDELSNQHPVIPMIIEYRQYTKLMGTYIDGLFSRLDSEEKLHTEYKQFLTSTGRLSSTDPNLQNIPAIYNPGGEIRKMFVSQFEGGHLVAADYSQIELRLLAHLSGDEVLIKAFNDGADIHTSTASLMFGVAESMVTPAMRKQAKAINFGIIYGKGEFSLAKELNIFRNEAKRFIEKYFATYPLVRGYLDDIILKARESGEVRTVLGRIRRIPEIKASNFVTRSHAERAATNMPLQGSSADLIKLAMVKVDSRMKELNLRSKLILQVHDELIADCVPGEEETVAKLLKTEMESVYQLSVPLTADVEIGQNWFEV